MEHQAFICYASEDEVTAGRVCAELESHGVRCWIAPRDVLPGMDYAQAIIEAIAQSRVIVLIFSEHSNESRFVRSEVERAVAKDVTILPVRVQDVPLSPSLEFFIASTQWLDAVASPLEDHLSRLTETVRQLLCTTTSAPVEEEVATPAPIPKPALEGEPAGPPICAECGASLRPGTQFCRKCGKEARPKMEPALPQVVQEGVPAQSEEGRERVADMTSQPPAAIEGLEPQRLTPAEAAAARPEPTSGAQVAVARCLAADPARRTIAGLVDLLIAAWGCFLLTLIFSIVGLAVGIVLSILYIWLGNIEGRTIGKRLFRLAVVRSVPGADCPLPVAEAMSRRPGLALGSLRTLITLLGVLPLGLGFWSMFWHRDEKTWQDIVTDTLVVDIHDPSRDRAGSKGQ